MGSIIKRAIIKKQGFHPGKGILEKAIPPRQLTRVCPSAITRQSPRLRQNLTR